MTDGRTVRHSDGPPVFACLKTRPYLIENPSTPDRKPVHNRKKARVSGGKYRRRGLIFCFAGNRSTLRRDLSAGSAGELYRVAVEESAGGDLNLQRVVRGGEGHPHLVRAVEEAREEGELSVLGGVGSGHAAAFLIGRGHEIDELRLELAGVDGGFRPVTAARCEGAVGTA